MSFGRWECVHNMGCAMPYTYLIIKMNKYTTAFMVWLGECIYHLSAERPELCSIAQFISDPIFEYISVGIMDVDQEWKLFLFTIMPAMTLNFPIQSPSMRAWYGMRTINSNAVTHRISVHLMREIFIFILAHAFELGDSVSQSVNALVFNIYLLRFVLQQMCRTHRHTDMNVIG